MVRLCSCRTFRIAACTQNVAYVEKRMPSETLNRSAALISERQPSCIRSCSLVPRSITPPLRHKASSLNTGLVTVSFGLPFMQVYITEELAQTCTHEGFQKLPKATRAQRMQAAQELHSGPPAGVLTTSRILCPDPFSFALITNH